MRVSEEGMNEFFFFHQSISRIKIAKKDKGLNEVLYLGNYENFDINKI